MHRFGPVKHESFKGENGHECTLPLADRMSFMSIMHYMQNPQHSRMDQVRTYEPTKPGTCRVAQSMGLYDRAKAVIAGRTHLFGRRAEMQAFGVSPIYSSRQHLGCGRARIP
jgi:hypothetical protein